MSIFLPILFASNFLTRHCWVKSGDQVRVVSATNPEGVWDLGNGTTKAMIGKVQVTEPSDRGWLQKRAGGVHANAAMWVDPHLKNTCMIDKVGGSVSFYDTKVKLIKI